MLLPLRQIPAAWVLGILLSIAETVLAAPPGQPPVLPEDPVPYNQSPIRYSEPETADPITDLQRRLDDGTVTLKFDEGHGYLRSVLEHLAIPQESQVLVFSKSSANVALISPATPRAIYFNEQVYVGWTPDIPALEISTVDPQKGANFYTLTQLDDGTVPRFERAQSCLLCHASTSTMKVPGHLVRSFTTDRQGRMKAGYSRITGDTPFENRWGGWYVTGTHGPELAHLGNLVGQEAAEKHKRDSEFGGNVTDLAPYFKTAPYLTPHSDLVALMLLDHQVHVQNLLTRLNFESRLDREITVETAVLRALLFADSPGWTTPVTGTTDLATRFSQHAPRDAKGRSLRDLELKTQLVKYRLSYVIDTPAFTGLPVEIRNRLWERLWRILSENAEAEEFGHLPAEERQAILDIVRETIPTRPDFCR